MARGGRAGFLTGFSAAARGRFSADRPRRGLRDPRSLCEVPPSVDVPTALERRTACTSEPWG